VCGKNLRGEGFSGGGYYGKYANAATPENDSKANNLNEKAFNDSKTMGILSLILWIVSPVAGFILGILAIHYGRKSKNSTAVTMGAIGIVISVLVFLASLIVVSINYKIIVNWIYDNMKMTAAI